MFLKLTATQQQIRRLVALGFSAKDISNLTGKKENTVNTHIKNIKIVRQLQKITEIAADYWCEKIGTTLKEQRDQIVASCVCIAFVFSFSVNIDATDKRRFRFRCRREQIEAVEIYTTAA